MSCVPPTAPSAWISFGIADYPSRSGWLRVPLSSGRFSQAATALRYRHNIGADHIRLFYNVTPEFASFLGVRSLGERAKSAVISSLADVILISGMAAGTEPRLDTVKEVKAAVGDTVPVLLNTGGKVENIRQYLSVADGVIVGSSLKVDGYTWNPVDEKRVKAFMAEVKEARGK
jgi:membrane complex biogenesis BtpA family protein